MNLSVFKGVLVTTPLSVLLQVESSRAAERPGREAPRPAELAHGRDASGIEALATVQREAVPAPATHQKRAPLKAGENVHEA